MGKGCSCTASVFSFQDSSLIDASEEILLKRFDSWREIKAKFNAEVAQLKKTYDNFRLSH